MKIYQKDDQIATENLTPSLRVYGEQLIENNQSDGTKEYRLWNPHRSKLAAGLLNGLTNLKLEENSKVLYLGASTGTTVSHISDLVPNGLIYAVEFSPVSMRKLVRLCENRPNIAPILSDATKPKNYLNQVEKVDLVYCDVAQAKQSELFMENMNLFLKEEGQGLIMIKSRSINVNLKPKVVFKEEERKLKENGFRVLEKIKLEPYEKDHKGFLVEKAF